MIFPASSNGPQTKNRISLRFSLRKFPRVFSARSPRRCRQALVAIAKLALACAASLPNRQLPASDELVEDVCLASLTQELRSRSALPHRDPSETAVLGIANRPAEGDAARCFGQQTTSVRTITTAENQDY